MAKVAITESYLEDIADAIRAKTGMSSATYYPSQMANAIMTISGSGGITPTGTISIIENGTYNVTNYASAEVSVPTGSTINNQNKSVTPTESSQSITYDSGYTGLGTVTVGAISSTYVGSGITTNPTPTASGATVTIPAGYYSTQTTKSVDSGAAGTPTASKGTVSNHAVSVTPSVTNTTGYISGGTKTGTAVTISASELVSGNKAISSNGTNIDVTNYATVSVSVPTGGTISNQNKSVTPTESEQEVTYDSGYTGLGTVTVGAINSTYVGSGITSRSSSDLTASGATVTVPAGYYASQATKSVSNGSATGPSSLSASSATITTGTNTITLTKTSVTTTPTVSAGYVSGATASTATVALTASVTVNPTPTASGATVTIPAGYYSSQTTKSVSSGSATGPSTVSSTGASISTGTNTLTLTKTNVSTTPTVSAGYVSSATSSTATVALTASVTTKAAATYTPTTSNQTIASDTYLTGTQTISGDANLIAGNIKKNVSIFGVTGSYEGSGGSGETGMVVATKTATLSSAASSISFTGLSGEPTSFVVTSSSDQTTGGTKVVAVAYDGTSVFGMDITTQMTNDTGFSQSYSNGTLTITATSASFQANEYKLVYSYGGTTENIGTASVQVGSGATSITFTGLEDEPEYFSCVFKSTFSTSSGYQRVVEVVYDGTSTYGHEMDSSAKYSAAHWSYSYNNGSLTITSNGTNAGGYFHQPGYYQLTYAIGGSSTLQKKTVTPTSSSQTVTADTAQGYTALSQVTVEGVTCTNLTAANIKSGVTVNIGTSSDNDSVTSVTGTYSASGGGASIDTKTTTSSNRPTSLSFTSMEGEPQAFVLRCTSSMSRSSNSSYYYVAAMRYNGTNTNGNCWRMSNGNWTNITSGYSWSYSGTTLTLTSSGSTTSSPGCFYPGNYELVYIY